MLLYLDMTMCDESANISMRSVLEAIDRILSSPIKRLLSWWNPTGAFSPAYLRT